MFSFVFFFQETRLLDLHTEFAETVSSTREIIDDLKERVGELEGENEYLMEQAMNAGEGEGTSKSNSNSAATRSISLKLKASVRSVHAEYNVIKEDARSYLNEYGEMLSEIRTKVGLMGRAGGGAYDSHVMDSFADAILTAGTTKENSSIQRRSSLIKRRAKAEIKKKVKRRRASMKAVMKAADLKHHKVLSGGKTSSDQEENEKSEEESDDEEFDETIPLEETEEFQLAMTLKKRSYERDRRHLEAKLRKMKAEQAVVERESQHRLIEIQSQIEHAEEQHGNVLAASLKLKEAKQTLTELEKSCTLLKEEYEAMEIEDEKEGEEGEEGENGEDGEDAKEERAEKMRALAAKIVEAESAVPSARENVAKETAALTTERAKHDDVMGMFFFSSFLSLFSFFCVFFLI